MQVLCKLLLYNFYLIGVYDPLYSAVHPMKYIESDVMLASFPGLPLRFYTASDQNWSRERPGNEANVMWYYVLCNESQNAH